MKFWEAMKAMEEGKKVTYKGLRSYYCIQDGKLCKIWYSTGEKATEAYINLDLALNSDWEIYEEKEAYNGKFEDFINQIKGMEITELSKLLKYYGIEFEDNE